MGTGWRYRKTASLVLCQSSGFVVLTTGSGLEAGEEGDYLPIATPSPLEMTPALRWAAMEVSWLVGALSPVNHKGLYQGEQQMEDILMFH